jgi:hypothetical protein
LNEEFSGIRMSIIAQSDKAGDRWVEEGNGNPLFGSMDNERNRECYRTWRNLELTTVNDVDDEGH